jgi:hypothetical protein
MTLGWRSTDSTFGYSVPVDIVNSDRPADLGSGTRSVTFLVVNKTATAMSGTFQVTTTSGYYTNPFRTADAWKTVGTTASGTWTATLINSPRPQTKMNGFDFCASDNSAIGQMSIGDLSTGCGYPRIRPSWCGGWVTNGCTYK